MSTEPAQETLFDPEEDFQPKPKAVVALPHYKDLPPVFRQLVGNAPPKFKTATFIAAVAPLGCLATRLRFYYPFDQGPMAPLFQTIICSDQSGGKSFARNVENVIMAKQKARDNEQRRQEQAYRELKQTAAKNEKLPDPPKTAIICCPVSISIAQLIKRADSPVRLYGTPLTLWTFTEELATATETNKRAFSNIKSIMRTAYDLGSEYGVDYLGENTYSATVDILYNTMFCTTPSALDDYMDKKAIEGGNCTRTIIYDLGSQLGDEAPVFRRITEEQQRDIDHTIDQIMAGTYAPDGTVNPEFYVDMQWLWKDVRTWCSQKNLEAVKTGSLALGTFFKRSSVSAFRIATLCQYLYTLEAADGELTPRHKRLIKQIYHAMAEQILSGMIDKWGKRFEDLQYKRFELYDHQPRDLFSNLPKAFDRELLRETIKRLELTTPDWVFLSKWNAKGLIKRLSKNQFQKL
ncbi:MAG: hypothetical protein Q4B58_07725 [Bacteroidales bacterium]|nr:hypothetical protein [Bacteroidales bacterium]